MAYCDGWGRPSFSEWWEENQRARRAARRYDEETREYWNSYRSAGTHLRELREEREEEQGRYWYPSSSND